MIEDGQSAGSTIVEIPIGRFCRVSRVGRLFTFFVVWVKRLLSFTKASTAYCEICASRKKSHATFELPKICPPARVRFSPLPSLLPSLFPPPLATKKTMDNGNKYNSKINKLNLSPKDSIKLAHKIGLA